MIIYDSKKWDTLFVNIYKTFSESYNLKELLKLLIYALVYAIVITIVNIRYFDGAYTIDTVFFSLVGVILSLFLVFRLNTSYDRWWEGRKQWGKLVNDARTLALTIHSLLPLEDIKRRRFFVTNISNFATSLAWHLRSEKICREKIEPIMSNYVENFEEIVHIPNQIAAFMWEEMELMFRNGIIGEIDKLNIKDPASRVYRCVGCM